MGFSEKMLKNVASLTFLHLQDKFYILCKNMIKNKVFYIFLKNLLKSKSFLCILNIKEKSYDR